MNDIDVKICGLTNLEDALAAAELGADYLGFVLYSKSPRGIDAGRLAGISERLPGEMKKVGVFVNMPRGEVIRIAEDCGLYAVQIHGDEKAPEFRDMPVRIWRAVSVADGVCTPVPSEWAAERYVIDAHVPGQYGGSGELSDWVFARGLAEDCRVMLSGGLTPENVGEGIRAVLPTGVDVASGVEELPGKKDHKKVAEFISRARGAVQDGCLPRE
ncbi:MAG: phosphoribosylanthranilate isomerase [Kiritimatiellia bacterium]|jgi:phosphoribosylanthranilate isomerase|nr:phosphoribosylanthranilate isomerase [Kiritimatiellia bacterium]